MKVVYTRKVVCIPLLITTRNNSDYAPGAIPVNVQHCDSARIKIPLSLDMHAPCRHETDRRAALRKVVHRTAGPERLRGAWLTSSAHRADEVSQGVCVPSLFERVARLTCVVQRGAGNLLLA